MITRSAAGRAAVRVTAAVAAVWLLLAGSTGARAPQAAPAWAAKELRAGIIGTDTSHVPEFVKILHAHPEWKVRVVAAFKGGSPDLPLSATRLEGFARTIVADHGVRLVDSVEALVAAVDVVLLTSVDGRPHLAQAAPVFAARKPVFIDKPLAASLDDARRIAARARETRTPFFTASSMRFHPDLPRLRRAAAGPGPVVVEASYLLTPLAFHPDLYYYGIHGVEALYEVMGPGCERLTRRIEAGSDVTTCRWRDGRTGSYRALAAGDPPRPLITVTHPGGEARTDGRVGSEPLVEAIARFFHTGESPVDPAQTIEVFEFMDAADRSKARQGAEVRLADLRPAVQ